MNNKPNLIIIGVQKSGTTWLHQQLDKHPSIMMSSKKELNFFTGKNDITGNRLEEYYSNFISEEVYKYYGESTPGYFWNWSSDKNTNKVRSKIPNQIRETLGKDTKLILILRNPVERAISAYFHHAKMGRLTHKGNFFSEDANKSVIKNIIDMGCYSKHLEFWREKFGDDILIINQDDIKKKNENVIIDLEKYLDINLSAINGFWSVVHKGSELICIEDKISIDTSNKNIKYINYYRGKNKSGNISDIHVNLEDIGKLINIYSDDNLFRMYFGNKLATEYLR